MTQGIPTDSPYFNDACAGVATMACLHDPSRLEIVRAVRQMLLNSKGEGVGADGGVLVGVGGRVSSSLRERRHANLSMCGGFKHAMMFGPIYVNKSLIKAAQIFDKALITLE